MRDLFLISALFVQVFVLEDLGDVRGLVHQNIPLSRKEELDSAVSAKWLVDILTKNVGLVDILEKGNEGYPKGDGRDVFGVSWW